MILTNATVKGNPFTPPSWRWEAAEQLLKQPDRNLSPHDQVTRDALDYQKTRDRLKYPEIDTAHQIFEEDGLLRAELEARILVGQSDLEIAEFCNLTPEVVQVYADLFFCVRDVPGGSDWKLRYAVGQPHFYRYQDHNLRQMWNWFGLMGESLILNHVIESYYDELRPDDEPTLSIYFRPTSSVDLNLQARIAEQILPNFQPKNRWEHEFMFYSQSIMLLATPEERDRALQEYRKDRIKYVYKYLTGRIQKQPPKRIAGKPETGSPEKVIKKIQKRLRSLETCTT